MSDTEKLSECEKLRLVIDCSPNMTAYVDSSKKYRIINRAYHDFFEVDENEIIGRHVSEVLGDSFYNIVKKYIDIALSGKSTAWESHHSDSDRNEFVLSFRLDPYIDPDGNNNGYLISVEDVTEEKLLALDTPNHSLNLC